MIESCFYRRVSVYFRKFRLFSSKAFWLLLENVYFSIIVQGTSKRKIETSHSKKAEKCRLVLLQIAPTLTPRLSLVKVSIIFFGELRPTKLR